MSPEPSTLADKNQAYFDTLASPSNRHPWMKDLTNQIQTELIARLDWIGILANNNQDAPGASEQTTPRIRLLDYACGSGELSRTLLPYVSEARGIDVSGAMVREYNDHALAAGIPEEKMHAVQGNILAPSLPPSESQEIPFAEKEWFDFDIILLSMALHHVPSPSDAITKLTARLAQGGVLIIIDWLLSSIVYHDSGEPRFGLPSHHGGGNNNHAHNVVPGSEHTITRAGFEKEEMEGFFRDAGCVDVGFLGFEEMTRLGDGEGAVEQKLFVARTRKG